MNAIEALRHAHMIFPFAPKDAYAYIAAELLSDTLNVYQTYGACDAAALNSADSLRSLRHVVSADGGPVCHLSGIHPTSIALCRRYTGAPHPCIR